jgi:hypothetical protein
MGISNILRLFYGYALFDELYRVATICLVWCLHRRHGFSRSAASCIRNRGEVHVGSTADPRRLGRNGQLRILFREVAPLNGVEQKVETNLEGVAVAKGEHLKLDNEGGAEVTTPRTRYLTTGIQVMLAATQASPDRDAGQGQRPPLLQTCCQDNVCSNKKGL